MSRDRVLKRGSMSVTHAVRRTSPASLARPASSAAAAATSWPMNSAVRFAARNRRRGPVMAAPTRDDAFLMVELAKWGTALGLGDALPALISESFDPESADLGDA